MHFLIADSFSASLGKLAASEQKAVKETAFDLQLNPEYPSHQLHKLDRAKDKRFWSVRVNRDIRIILHRSDEALLLCYVDHHDKAYRWAERRKLETHPKTGAAQLLEIRETQREVVIPTYVHQEQPPTPALSHCTADQLLQYGVPTAWTAEVLNATEEQLYELVEYLPAEAAEALLELATGGQPKPPEPLAAPVNPFAHPDAQRRFRVLENREELARALEYPWEKWAVFLHPAQRAVAERRFSGPARVAGSAGTGKTVVALHRAVHLAKTYPDRRILLTTFSPTLAVLLRQRLKQLVFQQPHLAERIDVEDLDSLAQRLYRSHAASQNWPDRQVLNSGEQQSLLQQVLEQDFPHLQRDYRPAYLWAEWALVVNAWQLYTWETYRDVKRLGRRLRLAESKRETLWQLYTAFRAAMHQAGGHTMEDLYSYLHNLYLAEPVGRGGESPYQSLLVDEAQDVSIAQLRFLSSLCPAAPDNLFFAGDLGQRIFQQPFSWKSLGVDVRGRAAILKINYRTSHQIRSQADRLLDSLFVDVDGEQEDRSHTVSVFNGPQPTVFEAESEQQEQEHVAAWVLMCTGQEANPVLPHELAVFTRTSKQLPRAQAVLEQVGLSWQILDSDKQPQKGSISLATMHKAKGLEFRAVVIMACDEDVLPLESRLTQASEESELNEAYQTEQNLLYVAATRAREYLLITGVEPISEFLEDFLSA